jgi:hypothetical protein
MALRRCDKPLLDRSCPSDAAEDLFTEGREAALADWVLLAAEVAECAEGTENDAKKLELLHLSATSAVSHAFA